MSRQTAHHTKQFKLDAINYRKEHPDLTQVECAKNLGIGVSTLARREAQFRDNDGDIPVIGSGSYASEEEKEITRAQWINYYILPHHFVFYPTASPILLSLYSIKKLQILFQHLIHRQIKPILLRTLHLLFICTASENSF